MTNNEIKVLGVFEFSSIENCYNFKHVSKITGLNRYEIKKTIKPLVDAGHVQFVRGLMDGDGMVAGSGYHITDSGRDALEWVKS